MQKIVPCLWFDQQAEEAVQFYTTTIPNSRIGDISRYGEGAPLPAGTALTVTFELEGQSYMALNGGPHFSFTPAVSFVIHCDSQEEIDRLWAALGEGGAYERCGWLRDRYGLSWQIVPRNIGAMMRDSARAGRVMAQILTMDKLDMGVLQRAYDGD